MERKIGETFEYEGEKLKVIKAGTACDGCYFKGKSCDNRNYDITGICGWTRKDNQPVRFIKVTEEQQDEQPQEETGEVKERKIGEVFELEGKKLQVRESHRYSCDGCFFNGHCEHSSNPIIGLCEKDQREDEKDVIFVEVQEQEEVEEQHQEEQPKLNLCEILRNCPRGTKLYSTVLGYVIFQGIIEGEVYPIYVSCENGVTENFTTDGKMFIDLDGECTLFPSKEQRIWADFIAPWNKKERFDPKTLKAFDKVIFKGHGMWFCGLFSHIHNSYACVGETYYKCVIPYNDDTKHLVGTKDEAPEFYKYWED